MIAFQTLAKMVAPALTVSMHILVRVPWDLVEATVKTVSKIPLIVGSSFVKGGLVFGAQVFASLFHPLAKTQL